MIGTGSYIALFGLCFFGLMILLVKEVIELNNALDESKKSSDALHNKMAEKIADIEIDKMYLENKINRLEQTIALWQDQSEQLHDHVTVLSGKLKTPFEDEKTKESNILKFRSAA